MNNGLNGNVIDTLEYCGFNEIFRKKVINESVQ